MKVMPVVALIGDWHISDRYKMCKATRRDVPKSWKRQKVEEVKESASQVGIHIPIYKLYYKKIKKKKEWERQNDLARSSRMGLSHLWTFLQAIKLICPQSAHPKKFPSSPNLSMKKKSSIFISMFQCKKKKTKLKDRKSGEYQQNSCSVLFRFFFSFILSIENKILLQQ